MSLKDEIAAARVALEDAPTDEVGVVFNGKLRNVVVTKLLPDDWQQLVAENQPRTGHQSDNGLGYNQNELPRSYPVERIKIDGEQVDAETWREFFEIIEPVDKNNVNTLMWGLNVFEAVKRLQELGKVVAGQPLSSPANRASRRVASRAGNQQK